MFVDSNWIRRNFFTLNDRFFNGSLPTPMFIVNCSTRYLGQCSYHYNRNFFGQNVGSVSYAIRISNQYSRNEGDFLNTLLHEMIHLYFYFIGKDYVGHGWEFQQMARSFDKYGFNIQTCSDVCTNLHPDIYGRSFFTRNIQVNTKSASLCDKLFTLMYRMMIAFVLWTFLSNKDAMKVIGFVAKMAATNIWDTICRLWTGYDVTNRLIECGNFLGEQIHNIIEFLVQSI